MAYPDDYKRSYSFTAFQQAQGDNSFPGTQIDNEFDEIHVSIDEINEFLALIARSDGQLTNGLVTWDSLSAEVKAKFQAGGAAPGEPVDPAVVYAGPPSGPDALPTFRPLAKTDLPRLTQPVSGAIANSLYDRAAYMPDFSDFGVTQRNIGGLRTVIGPAPGAQILVQDYAAAGRGGGGVFRWDADSMDADDAVLTVQPTGWVGSGRWKRIVDGTGRVKARWAGAQGDGTTDDTIALQRMIDVGKATGRGCELEEGDYLTGPLKLNGSSWQPTDITGQQAAALCLVGAGRSPFLCRLIAKAGAYSDTLKAVLTGRNMSGVVVSGFSIDSNNIADCSFDFRWVGTSDGNPSSAAPSCNNEFTSLWSYRANQTHFDFRQAADTLVSSCHCEGGTAPIAFDFRLGGGGIWMDTCFANTSGKILLASQNAGLQNCGIFGGVEITDQSLNYVHFDACHFYPYTPKRTLAAAPLATTSGSANLVITLGPHGLKVGNYLEVSGAVDVGGVTANSYINTSYLAPPAARTNAAPHKITAVTDTTVTVQMLESDGTTPHTAGSTATGGGSAVFITGRGYTVESNITGGASGSRMLKFTAAWFNDLGPVGQKYFGGRWVGGARFEACRFSAPVESVAGGSTVPYSDGLCYFDLANWTVAGNDGAPPLFWFAGCSFASSGGRPVSTEGSVLVGFEHRMNNLPSSVTEFEWPGDFRLPRSAFDKSRVRFGSSGWLWKDAGGLLRYINNGGTAPTADTDGNILGVRQSGTVSPLAASGNVTPLFAGSTYYDTVQNTLFFAFGATSADWVPIYDKGADVASAATVDLSLTTGDYVEITGTTTITSFGTAKAGIAKKLRFGSALTVTHNATSLIIPGNQNITVSAGNEIEVLSLGSGNWMVTGFSSFGANASFLVAGTVADARLPTAMAGKTLTTSVIVATANAQTGTTYTLVLADASKVVEMSNAAANTLTVPTNATAAFAVGTVIDIVQTGAGKTTIAAAGGVTINSTGGLLSIAAQWSTARLRKTATDTWVLTGSLIV